MPAPKKGFFRDIAAGWDGFWFTPRLPHTLAFMRILAGLVVFYVHLTYSWGLMQYVGPEGWVDKASADYMRRDITIWAYENDWTDRLAVHTRGNYYWSPYFHFTDATSIVAIHVFFLL